MDFVGISADNTEMFLLLLITTYTASRAFSACNPTSGGGDAQVDVVICLSLKFITINLLLYFI